MNERVCKKESLSCVYLSMRRLLYPFFIVSFLIFVGCEKNTPTEDVVNPDIPEAEPNEPIVNEEKMMEIKDAMGRSYLPFLHTDDTLYYYIPHDTDFSSLIPVATNETDSLFVDGSSVPFDGRNVDLSDFTKSIVFQTKNKTYDVILCDLPVLLIDTPNSEPIDSKTERKEGCVMKLIADNEEVELGTAGIRGRGNSSWLQPKKPYNIKLDKKAEILGMKKSKHWILLANAKYDHTQLHNATAFEIARFTDYPWVQSGKFVELILNGEHKGLYYLCEKVGVESGKIDIEMSLQDDLADCGYLLESLIVYEENALINQEINQFSTNVICSTGHGATLCTIGWEIKEPEDDIVSEQSDYIRECLTYVEKLIKDSLDSGKYRDYFDIETAINWWMVQELCVNEESSRTKNVYLYKKGRNGHFCLGPPWDLDAWSFGTAGLKRYWAKDYALYYKYLFKDPVFVSRVKEKWQEYKPIWEEKIPKFIDDQYRLIRRSAERNEIMWPDWIVPSSSYERSVMDMKDAFKIQLNWMDEQIANM